MPDTCRDRSVTKERAGDTPHSKSEKYGRPASDCGPRSSRIGRCRLYANGRWSGTMNRRRFLARLAAAGVGSSLSRYAQVEAQGQWATNATLTIDTAKPGPTIPPDFTGLSYE